MDYTYKININIDSNENSHAVNPTLHYILSFRTSYINISGIMPWYHQSIQENKFEPWRFRICLHSLYLHSLFICPKYLNLSAAASWYQRCILAFVASRNPFTIRYFHRTFLLVDPTTFESFSHPTRWGPSRPRSTPQLPQPRPYYPLVELGLPPELSPTWWAVPATGWRSSAHPLA